MGDIDRQRIQAVRKLQELGLVWHADAWRKATELEVLSEADAMHALLVSLAGAVALADGDAALEQEGADLIDDAGSLRHQPLAYAVQGL